MSPSDFLRSVASSCFLAARTLLYSPPNTATDFHVPNPNYVVSWVYMTLFTAVFQYRRVCQSRERRYGGGLLYIPIPAHATPKLSARKSGGGLQELHLWCTSTASVSTYRNAVTQTACSNITWIAFHACHVSTRQHRTRHRNHPPSSSDHL